MCRFAIKGLKLTCLEAPVTPSATTMIDTVLAVLVIEFISSGEQISHAGDVLRDGKKAYVKHDNSRKYTRQSLSQHAAL